jgi:thiol:disulfide interchange protein DsbD
MRTRILCLILLALSALPAWADAPVTWSARLDPADARAGEGARIIVTAKIQPTWHLYSLTRVSGPTPTSLALAPGKALVAAAKPIQPPPIKKHDPNFDTQVELYEGAVAFGLPVRVAPGAKGPQKASIKVRYMVCTDRSCLPPTTIDVPVAFTVATGPARADRAAPLTSVPPQPPGAKKAETAPGSGLLAPSPTDQEPGARSQEPGAATTGSFDERIKQAQSRGLGAFLWLALSMGFLALLTPCVFPMVPVTVSYFAKQQDAGRGGLRGPVAYCLGIIGTFTALGLLITLIFGATGIQVFATNPWVNLAMALLFIVLALNLFGVFEIIVPAWLLNRAYYGSQRGGLIGPVLMGLTFTLTSFTCTVPFVGTLLVTTAQGSTLWPLMGMLAFSTAFASPFFLLALFPQWLARMPKSGSWLTSVKAYMGFLELAAAAKFLSNADLVWQTKLLTRPIFLSVWSTIAVIAAGYLLGWFRLPHDGSVRPGFFRRGLGIATAVIGIWCLGAIGGRSLGELDAFLPPESYGAVPGATFASSKIPWEHDYDAAVARARSEGKALFINFTGYT